MAEETASGGPVRGPTADKGIPEEGVQPREKWANKLEFIFTVSAHAISLLTLCRFPYLCFIYGGGEKPNIQYLSKYSNVDLKGP